MSERRKRQRLVWDSFFNQGPDLTSSILAFIGVRREGAADGGQDAKQETEEEKLQVLEEEARES